MLFPKIKWSTSKSYKSNERTKRKKNKTPSWPKIRKKQKCPVLSRPPIIYKNWCRILKVSKIKCHVRNGQNYRKQIWNLILRNICREVSFKKWLERSLRLQFGISLNFKWCKCWLAQRRTKALRDITGDVEKLTF